MNRIGNSLRILSAAVALVVLLTFPVTARAAGCPGAAIVTSASSELIGAAHRGTVSAFASVVNRYADVNAIAMFALGQHRAELPRARRGEYVANTKRYIARFLAEKSGSYRGSKKLTIDSCHGNLVRTSVDGRSRVVWRLSGGRIADVQVSGVWLAVQLRSRFSTIVRRNHGDVSALLDHLRG